MLTLRLKPSLERRLEDLAFRTGRTKTFYATRAIEEQLPKFEQTSDVIESPARDVRKIRAAVNALKGLRNTVAKPDGMSVKEMIEWGRA